MRRHRRRVQCSSSDDKSKRWVHWNDAWENMSTFALNKRWRRQRQVWSRLTHIHTQRSQTRQAKHTRMWHRTIFARGQQIERQTYWPYNKWVCYWARHTETWSILFHIDFEWFFFPAKERTAQEAKEKIAQSSHSKWRVELFRRWQSQVKRQKASELFVASQQNLIDVCTGNKGQTTAFILRFLLFVDDSILCVFSLLPFISFSSFLCVQFSLCFALRVHALRQCQN